MAGALAAGGAFAGAGRPEELAADAAGDGDAVCPLEAGSFFLKKSLTDGAFEAVGVLEIGDMAGENGAGPRECSRLRRH